MRTKLPYLIATGLITVAALCPQVRAGQGTPVFDQAVAGTIQALNNSTHTDASAEIGLLQRQLQNMGDPQQYINLLQRNNELAPFTRSMSDQGVSTAIQAMQNGNSSSGLSFTGSVGKTLYPDDLSTAPGITNQTSFKKFGVFQDMVDNYQTQLTSYNQQMQSLQAQLQKAMTSLDQAKTQMETLKYQAEVNGLNALITALASKMNVAGQEALLQHAANQNDMARIQEVTRQQKASDQRDQMSKMLLYLKSTAAGPSQAP
jgi:hypothetical protein